MTLRECCRTTEQRLRTVYAESEAKWLVRIAFEHIKGYSQVDMLMKADEPVSEYIIEKVNEVTDRLLRHEPVQYIFGEARFYGLRLKVNSHTLIPRPETEELIDMIVRDANDRSDLHVMDACTGSGCIAIALARNLVFPAIDAFDISSEAVKVAQENASVLKTRVNFSTADALALTAPPRPLYDIIVSNPPYIADGERMDMSRNVLDYEPHIALFVPDDDPLRFYRAIAHYAIAALNHGGRLYFEINPIYATGLATELTETGFDNVRLWPDIHGRTRFATATRPAP